jgi:hypothetical protein
MIGGNPMGLKWSALSAWLSEALWYALFISLFFAAVVFILWCCCRLYIVARRKGFRPVGGMTLIMAAAFAGGAVGGVAAVMLPTEQWPESAENATIIAALFIAPLLTTAAVVVLVPRRRNRSGGARRVTFLFSAGLRRFEIGLRILAVGAIGAGLSAPLWATWNEGLRLLMFAGSLFAIGPLLNHYRARASRPGLEQTVQADARPPLFYLRPFARETDAFVWLPNKQVANYSSLPLSSNVFRVYKVSVEQYLTGALTETIGPVLALGNPLDVLPPEGAARTYAEDEKDGDEGWKRQFRDIGGRAAALLMTPAWSDELKWELREIRRQRWHTKLFLVTPPQPQSMWVTDKIYAGLIESARGVQRKPWKAAARQLRATGYAVDPAVPPPGSVLTFDTDGAPIVLTRGIRRPEEYAAAVHCQLARSGLAPHPPSIKDSASS